MLSIVSINRLKSILTTRLVITVVDDIDLIDFIDGCGEFVASILFLKVIAVK